MFTAAVVAAILTGHTPAFAQMTKPGADPLPSFNVYIPAGWRN